MKIATIVEVYACAPVGQFIGAAQHSSFAPRPVCQYEGRTGRSAAKHGGG
jgi:hypothetical protein